jgi:hypothetical protein
MRSLTWNKKELLYVYGRVRWWMLMAVTFYEDPTKLVGCTYCFT